MRTPAILLISFACAVLIYAGVRGGRDRLHADLLRRPAAGLISAHRQAPSLPHAQSCEIDESLCPSRSLPGGDGSQTTLAANDGDDEEGPRIDRFRVLVLRGKIRDREGKPLAGDIGISFTIYDRETGGTPMWQESQLVEANERGRFKALIGASTQEGLPTEVLDAGGNLWLDQHILLSNAATAPRLPLTRTENGLSAQPAEEPFSLPEESTASVLPLPETVQLSIESAELYQGSRLATDRSRRAHGRIR